MPAAADRTCVSFVGHARHVFDALRNFDDAVEGGALGVGILILESRLMPYPQQLKVALGMFFDRLARAPWHGAITRLIRFAHLHGHHYGLDRLTHERLGRVGSYGELIAIAQAALKASVEQVGEQCRVAVHAAGLKRPTHLVIRGLRLVDANEGAIKIYGEVS